jgi:hypothetical protein
MYVLQVGLQISPYMSVKQMEGSKKYIKPVAGHGVVPRLMRNLTD